MIRLSVFLTTFIAFTALIAPAIAGDLTGEFLQNYCVDCHSGPDGEGGLDLDRTLDGGDPADFATLVRVHDRVLSGEMPPAEVERPEALELKASLEDLAAEIRHTETQRRTGGRTAARRLTRSEYEQTLADLLHLPHLDVASMLPPDGRASGTDKVAAALQLSHIQIARYLDAAEAAIDAAIDPVLLHPEGPPTIDLRLLARENGRVAKLIEKRKEAVPVGGGVGLLRQPNTAQAQWTWSQIRQPVDGIYHIRMAVNGFVWDRGEVRPADVDHVIRYDAVHQTTMRQLARLGVPAENDADDPVTHEFTAMLRRGDVLQFVIETLDDRNLGKTPLEQYIAPGLAVHWIEVNGPLADDGADAPEWPPASYRQLFGTLPVGRWNASRSPIPPRPLSIVQNEGKRAHLEPVDVKKYPVQTVLTDAPHADAQRLLRQFAARAFRQIDEEQSTAVDDIAGLVKERIDEGWAFVDAMKLGLQAILCSPEFLFLDEPVGPLDDAAIASRLSYFLHHTAPDEPLRRAVAAGRLTDPAPRSRQVDRMLADRRSDRLIKSLCDQWLGLDQIAVTHPDEELYPEFDNQLLAAMVDEVRAFVRVMIDRDLGPDALVDAEFAMINARLAEHYGIAGVRGVQIREVPLAPDSVRGGLLTSAAVLKVTANGTTTSPVTRGVWINDRLLGKPVRPPPPGIPAVEPDLRGSVTIRDQLTRHQADDSCAACHREIDPPGYALESFDPTGAWRERYRVRGGGVKPDVDKIRGRSVRYEIGPPVDPSGQTAAGVAFDDVAGLRRALLSDRRQLARNLAERLVVYSTGAEIGFSDRPAVETILDNAEPNGYGLASLIHAVVDSELFLKK